MEIIMKVNIYKVNFMGRVDIYGAITQTMRETSRKDSLKAMEYGTLGRDILMKDIFIGT